MTAFLLIASIVALFVFGMGLLAKESLAAWDELQQDFGSAPDSESPTPLSEEIQ